MKKHGQTATGMCTHTDILVRLGREMIDESRLGGDGHIARVLGVDRARVQKWRLRNSIPPEYYVPIAKLAKSHKVAGVSVTVLSEAAAERRRDDVACQAAS